MCILMQKQKWTYITLEADASSANKMNQTHKLMDEMPNFKSDGTQKIRLCFTNCINIKVRDAQ